jgi:ferredoxin
MPKLTVNGVTTDVEQGTRLVLAIEDAGVNIGHRCGGIAKCTTCRVNFTSG